MSLLFFIMKICCLKEKKGNISCVFFFMNVVQELKTKQELNLNRQKSSCLCPERGKQYHDDIRKIKSINIVVNKTRIVFFFLISFHFSDEKNKNELH